jgi:primosomal replication protein N
VDGNRVRVSGKIADLDELRYTPAGIPIISFTIHHVSEQIEAETKRRVECEIPAIAMTEMAKRVAQIRQGTFIEVEGFLDRKSRNNQNLVLHVDKIELKE